MMLARSVLLAVTLLAGPAYSGGPNDGTCPYLRLSLSTPQRLVGGPADDSLQAEYLAVFGIHLQRAGFEVTEPTRLRFAWEAFSQVEALGEGRLAWSFAFLPMPGIADGAIEFPTFSVIDRAGGDRVQFTTYHGLEELRATEFPLRAAVASEKLATLYLPVARKLCAARGSNWELEQARLERIRRELSAEIERVAARRAEQTKSLELRPEPDAAEAGDGQR